MGIAAIAIAALILLPVAVVGVVLGLRSPVGVLVAAYAAIVPFGSAVDLPIPLPAPFDTLSSVMGLVATVGLAGHLALSRRSAPVLQQSMPAWLLFIGVAATTYAWSVAPRTTARELVLLTSVIGLYLLTALMPVTPAELHRIGSGIIGGATVASLIAFALLATGRTPIGRSGTPRFVITGDDPNHTAAGLLLPLVLAVHRAFDHTLPASRRAVAAAAAVLMSGGVVLTGSRGGLLAAIVAVGVVALHDANPRRLALFGASVVLVGMLALTIAPPALQARLTTTTSTGRTDIWRLGLDACAQHCIAGSGWGTFPDVYTDQFVTNPRAGGFRDEGYRAHNIWLQALVEMGIAGFFALVVAYGLTIKEAWRLSRSSRVPALAALIGLAVASSLVSNLIFKYFWLVPMYVALASAADRHREQGSTVTAEPASTLGRAAVKAR